MFHDHGRVLVCVSCNRHCNRGSERQSVSHPASGCLRGKDQTQEGRDQQGTDPHRGRPHIGGRPTHRGSDPHNKGRDPHRRHTDSVRAFAGAGVPPNLYIHTYTYVHLIQNCGFGFGYIY